MSYDFCARKNRRSSFSIGTALAKFSLATAVDRILSCGWNGASFYSFGNLRFRFAYDDLTIIFISPLLFLVIRLSTKFGNLLYIALFLSLLSAGVSALYISHSIGFFLGVPVGKNANLIQGEEFGNDRILIFRGVKILTNYVSSRSAISRVKAEPTYTKTIYFHVAPLVSSNWKEGDPIYVWVACGRMELPNCVWGNSVFFWGESLKTHSLYPYYKTFRSGCGKGL